MAPGNSGINVRRMLALPEVGLTLALLALFAVTAVKSRTFTEFRADPASGQRVAVERNSFLKPSNLHQIGRDASLFAIMAVGMTLVLVSGGVDLSIGSIFCLSAIVAAKVMSAETYSGRIPVSLEQELGWIKDGTLPAPGMRILLGCAAGVLTGAFCGALNGVLIVLLKSPPFLITLGTMLIFRGIAFLLTLGSTVAALPQEFVAQFGQKDWFLGFTPHVPLMLLAVAAGVVFLNSTVPGRMTLAIGGNEEAARTAGLPVERIKVTVYALSGAIAGLTGLLYCSFYGSIQSGDGTGYELKVIAAAVIGGASLSGGRGTAIGAALGALFLMLISPALASLEINQNYEQLVIGAVIVTAAGLNRARERILGV